MFGIDVPIFAFSHCRDVVAEVSKAGGMGVLGISGFTPDQLEVELDWLDGHVGEKSYGVDALIPQQRIEEGDIAKLKQMIPQEHQDFQKKILSDAGIPELPGDYQGHFSSAEESGIIGDRPWQLLDVSLKREKVTLYVNALGSPPPDIIEKCRQNGVKVAAMAGKVRHAVKHKEAGCDFVIAVGAEAAGHTGDISTFVLTPQIIDAVVPVPVLAAGGISTGKHIAAALALGAQGVWTGSVWLASPESELSPVQRKKIIDATSEDTVRSRCLTGKPVRMLRSKFTDAWEGPEAPEPLPMPLQSLLTHNASQRFDKFEAVDMLTYPAGQGIGQLHNELSVKQVMQDMFEDYLDAAERICSSLDFDA